MLEIKIRHAKDADVETIINFQIACAKETEDRDLFLPDIERAVSLIITSMLTGPLGPPILGEYIVVENQKNKIIACCLLQNQFSDWNNGYYMWIESCYVSPDYRGNGILQKMYLHAEQLAINTGKILEIRSSVDLTNELMKKAIKKIGYNQTNYQIFSKKI